MISRNSCSIFGVFLMIAATPAMADSDLFILRRAEKGLVVEKVTIADGVTRKWKLGEDGFIDVILPVGPGGSGAIVQSAAAPTVEATSRNGTLSLVTIAGKGQRYERTAPSAEDLAALDIRISARTGTGESVGAFIRAYRTVEIDPIGPVEDIFGGKIPLAQGDCTIHTNTFTARPSAGAPIAGSVPIRSVNGHHLAGTTIGGVKGEMVVDLAAGATVVSRKALPEGTEIHESVMTQQSPEGVKRLATEIGGATNSAKPLGVATLAEFSVGDVVFRNAEVLVMEELPPVGSAGVVGILGVDLLSRARSLSLPYGAAERTAAMKLGEPSKENATATVPLSMIGTRAYCRARVGAAEICFIVDTGSPITILDEPAAKAAGIVVAQDAEQIRGIGAAKTSLRLGTARSFTLGEAELNDVTVRVGSLPVFGTIRGTAPVGILGNDVLAQFSRIEINFDGSELRLFK